MKSKRITEITLIEYDGEELTITPSRPIYVTNLRKYEDQVCADASRNMQGKLFVRARFKWVEIDNEIL